MILATDAPPLLVIQATDAPPLLVIQATDAPPLLVVITLVFFLVLLNAFRFCLVLLSELLVVLSHNLVHAHLHHLVQPGPRLVLAHLHHLVPGPRLVLAHLHLVLVPHLVLVHLRFVYPVISPPLVLPCYPAESMALVQRLQPDKELLRYGTRTTERTRAVADVVPPLAADAISVPLNYLELSYYCNQKII